MTELLHGAWLPFWRTLAASPVNGLEPGLRALTERRVDELRHGDLARWQAAVAELPAGGCEVVLDADVVTARGVAAGTSTPDELTRARWRHALQQLHPWRKGPFELAGIDIDSEWRSDMKWRRVLAAGVSLRDACVLDVGSGNGYYGLRMLGAGARLVLGVDPTLLYCLQAIAVQRFTQCHATAVLPLALEQLPVPRPCFDVVFSMGVLYHQRDAQAHLQSLQAWLRPGGTLVLETLVLPDDGDALLEPPDRYARMRNVHAVPRTDTLLHWLARAGFRGARRVDLSPTTPAEQRSTAWMRFESLAAALNPNDPARTIEGLPAPLRALLLARAPA